MLFLFRAAKWGLLLLPRGAYPALAELVGKLVWRFNSRKREIVTANLIPIVGPVKAAQIGPQLLGNFFKNTADLFCPPADLADRIRFHNPEVVQKAYQQHGKLLIVTAHIGTWEGGIRWLVRQGYPTSGVYASDDSAFVRWMQTHREQGAEWIGTSDRALENCLAALKRGRILGMVADLPFKEEGRAVEMFGQTTRLPIGPWLVAIRSRTPVVIAFTKRIAPSTYEGHFSEPILPEGDLRNDIERMQGIYRGALEKTIQERPEQWGVLQPFWVG